MIRLSPIEQAERTLAKLVQNAKARGLGWCSQGSYDYDGDKLVRCCARGAAYLSPQVALGFDAMLGNDDPTSVPIRNLTIDFDIGAAFRDVMTHHEEQS